MPLTELGERGDLGSHLCCEVSSSCRRMLLYALFSCEYTLTDTCVCVYMCICVNTHICFPQLYHLPLFSYKSCNRLLMTSPFTGRASLRAVCLIRTQSEPFVVVMHDSIDQKLGLQAAGEYRKVSQGDKAQAVERPARDSFAWPLQG